jgi:hypothetical protein
MPFFCESREVTDHTPRGQEPARVRTIRRRAPSNAEYQLRRWIIHQMKLQLRGSCLWVTACSRVFSRAVLVSPSVSFSDCTSMLRTRRSILKGLADLRYSHSRLVTSDRRKHGDGSAEQEEQKVPPYSPRTWKPTHALRFMTNNPSHRLCSNSFRRPRAFNYVVPASTLALSLRPSSSSWTAG